MRVKVISSQRYDEITFTLNPTNLPFYLVNMLLRFITVSLKIMFIYKFFA